MAAKMWKQLSPRHGLPFDSVPTRRGSYWGGSIVVHYPREYGAILDCVLEMADDISTGNGVTVNEAIDQVLKDEGWRILPTHRRRIVARLLIGEAAAKAKLDSQPPGV